MTDDRDGGDAVDTTTALTEHEREIVSQCLRAAVEGPFFPEWEFQTLMGVSREEISGLRTRWQASVIDHDDEDVVRNVLNHLIGYPHGHETEWRAHIDAGLDAVSSILAKLSKGSEPRR